MIRYIKLVMFLILAILFVNWAIIFGIAAIDDHSFLSSCVISGGFSILCFNKMEDYI